MSDTTTTAAAPSTAKPAMSVFERFLTFWVALCIVAGIALGQLLPGVLPRDRQRDRGAGQHPGRGARVADDRADAAEDRPRRAGRGRTALARHRHHGRRQLAGQAVLDGAARLDLHRASVPALSAGRPDRELHGRADPARRRALHGHGVRLVEPRRWRAAFHALAGGAQRHDHGRGLRADRRPAARPFLDHRALGHAVPVGRALHRRAGDRGAALARGGPAAGRSAGCLAPRCAVWRRFRCVRCC